MTASLTESTTDTDTTYTTRTGFSVRVVGDTVYLNNSQAFTADEALEVSEALLLAGCKATTHRECSLDALNLAYNVGVRS